MGIYENRICNAASALLLLGLHNGCRAALIATTETNNNDLARTEILWKAADALRGLTPETRMLSAEAKKSESPRWR